MARVLVIDDDPVTRLAMGETLANADHQVAYAADGEQGIAFYSKERFDVVIVDLVMPVKNGLQTIRELKDMYPHARIIAISGVSPEDLDLAEDYGALRSLAKPIAPDTLLDAVDGALRRSIGWDDVNL